MKKFILLLLMIFGFTTTASALSLGIDPAGGSQFTEIDHIVYQTDTGLALGFIPGLSVPVPTDPYDTRFLLQARVGTVSLDNTAVDIGLQSGGGNYEWTFTADFIETVTAQSSYVNSFGQTILSALFSHGVDTNSIFNMYMDDLNAGGTLANANNVSGYTDGTPILSGHLLKMESNFDFNTATGIGVGSFNATVSVDTYNATFLDIPDPVINFQLVSTGTVNQPATIFPSVMFDGTSTSTDGAIMVKFDGSTDPFVIPEPATLFLFGFGMLGICGLVRRKQS